MSKQTRLSDFGDLLEQEDKFLNQKISILQDGLNGKESYTGICIRIDTLGYYLKILSRYSKYDFYFIAHSSIISILRYNKDTNPIY